MNECEIIAACRLKTFDNGASHGSHARFNAVKVFPKSK
jgi:hypothetical protein